jgi:hypothetical protein
MKTVLNAAVATTLFAVILAGEARAQSEPAPAQGSMTQPFPGIIVTPPSAPSADTQQSCPATSRPLELIV